MPGYILHLTAAQMFLKQTKKKPFFYSTKGGGGGKGKFRGGRHNLKKKKKYRYKQDLDIINQTNENIDNSRSTQNVHI